MHWIALLCPADELPSWGWHGLQFTPRVAQVDEALLLEVSASERLWGGRRKLLQDLLGDGPLGKPLQWAQGATGLLALALLRLKAQGIKPPVAVPDGLPLEALTSAIEHAPMLARAGCASWGELRALPRAGVARRFGAPLLEALDAAYGERPEAYPWLTIPDVFDMNLELPSTATAAPELMWTAQRLLRQLQVWLQMRQRGILAMEFEWTLDLRRLDGKILPRKEQLAVRTAQPTQDMHHLRRLVGEHLDRARLSAPANHLRLRTLETTPWAGASTSLLPEDNRKGDRLHELVERLSVRLGAHNVLMAQPQADHRPERMQRWLPARDVLPKVVVPDVVQGLAPEEKPKPVKPRRKAGQAPAESSDALYPAWLLPEPLELEVRAHVPHYGGPLRRLTRARRVEAAWWEHGGLALRDYFIARSEVAGLVWIYRERPASLAATGGAEYRWYLHGLYA
ncbi:MAG: DNA polymerase Y family protein [Comamonadaceae bacterium]|nr:MAG: DNA polymerase Y family protein [Comamonadaceae bacterium]